MTIKEIIYQLKHLTAREQISRANGFSDRWLYREFLKYRARIIKQKREKDIPISQENFYDTSCIELIEVSANDCVCSLDGTGCDIVYRSKEKTPQSIIPFKSVSNLSKSKNYELVNVDNVKYKLDSRYSSINEKTICYLSDNGEGEYLYVISSNLYLEKVRLSTVPYDPLELFLMKDCDGSIKSPCKSAYDYDFKIESSFLATISEMIIKNYLEVKLKVPDDRLNNEKSDYNSK